MPGLTGALESKVLLQRYRDCRDEDDAERLLERLVTRHAEAVIRGTLARKALEAAEIETVYALAAEGVIAFLRQARARENAEPIRNFAACVRQLTERAFGDFLDEKYPARRRLKQRLRYLFGNQETLARWLDRDGRVICGFAAWRAAQSEPRSGLRWQNLREDPCAVAERIWTQNGSPAQAALAPLASALLLWAGHPVPLEELVTIIGRIQNIEEPARLRAEPNVDGDDPLANLPDPEADVEGAMQRRESLRLLWAEICRLPLKKRKALLLGGDKFETGMLEMVVSLRVARLCDIAAALEYPWETFARIWNELPWEDKRIAVELGISPENVRFQRCDARQRLKARFFK